MKLSAKTIAAQSSPDIARKVRTEQMRILFERGPVATVAATAFAFAMAWQLRDEVAHAALFIWLTAKCAVSIPRIVFAAAFSRGSHHDLRWLDWFRALLLVDGVAWGSAGLLMMPTDKAGVSVLVAMLCGVATISTFNIQSDFRSCLSFVVPALLPTAVIFLLRGDSFGVYGALSILTYLYLLLTAARRAEQRFRELLTLRFSNAELTQKLTEALEKSKAEALAKDGFVAGMSHELRTPLHGILGLARMLQRSVELREKQTVKLIIRSSEHLLGLINNVLEFSKFSAHGVDIDIESPDIDVARTIDDAVALCAPSAEDRQLSLSLRQDVVRPLIAAIDPFRLRQIVLNLVGNAVKFTDAGGRVLVVVEESTDGKKMTITVQDSGIGMTAATMEKIFEPFSQADVSSTRRHGGTGLGLNITHSICQRLGGEIHCKSQLGKGSIFTVTLPLLRSKSLQHRASLSDSGFADLDQISDERAAGTVLLAEDNEVNAIVGEYALVRLGVGVTRAETGAAVVERMCTNGARPNLVLLDCQMPVMDGYEATRIVRDYERRNGLPAVPIVALTASVFQSDREHCREVGMNAFLPKPFSEHELRGVLSLFWVIPRDEDWSDSSYAALLL
jgi:signal transduction histidine kinase/CheY-like chemotaxis protein